MKRSRLIDVSDFVRDACVAGSQIVDKLVVCASKSTRLTN